MDGNNLDLVYCDGKDCPIKENCLRYRPRKYTDKEFWYFPEPPYQDESCSMFYPKHI